MSDNFTPKEIEYKIGSLTLSFKEFIYGFEKLMEVASMPGNSHIILFYQNSIYYYLSSYFLLNGEGNVFKTLKEVGKENLASEIKNILDENIDKRTVGQFIQLVRNKTLAHGTYSSKYSYEIATEIGDFQKGLVLAYAIRRIYEHIKILHDKLMTYLPKDSGY